MNIIAFVFDCLASGHTWAPQGAWGKPLKCEHCGYKTRGFVPEPKTPRRRIPFLGRTTK